MKIPTIRLRHKRDRKRTIKVNQCDYAADLGTFIYQDWQIDGGERHNDAAEPTEVRSFDVQPVADETPAPQSRRTNRKQAETK